MDILKLHDLEPSSVFWETRFFMTEKDVVNLQRIVTSWYDLTKTDIGRKALEVDCYEMFKESMIFSKRLMLKLNETLTAIQRRKESMNKEQFMRFESRRKSFEHYESERDNFLENNPFVATSNEIKEG